MLDEPEEETPFASPTANYVDRISILATMLPGEFCMSRSACALAVNAFQFGDFIFYNVGGLIADCWGIKPAFVA